LRFLADGMLGKLTRWLRMLGHDVEYFNDLDDDQLISVAKDEERVLLTRDVRLFREASVGGVESFLVKGRSETEKLAELAGSFGLKLEVYVESSRCPKCNAEISSVPKEEVRDKVPESTSRFYEDFWICRDCGQVYWRGSHWKRINRTLNAAKQMVGVAEKPE
jgi:uncharacterized protein with PIN domain